jgi:hypothetical protein
VIDNFSYELIDKKTWRVQADFARQGLLPDGKEMITKSRHRWTVIDNPQERFARIKTAAVEVLEPFKPKT